MCNEVQQGALTNHVYVLSCCIGQMQTRYNITSRGYDESSDGSNSNKSSTFNARALASFKANNTEGT